VTTNWQPSKHVGFEVLTGVVMKSSIPEDRTLHLNILCSKYVAKCCENMTVCITVSGNFYLINCDEVLRKLLCVFYSGRRQNFSPSGMELRLLPALAPATDENVFKSFFI
jgi:hypothetical protein